MKMDVNFNLFCDMFTYAGRKGTFSYMGLRELFNYLENAYDDYNLDVVELCCEFTEDSIKDVLKEYELSSLDDLLDRTEVIAVNDETIIYRRF